ncbi:MAG: uroporphyrinogen-III C-methyltransferase [Halioglobus sp.]
MSKRDENKAVGDSVDPAADSAVDAVSSAAAKSEDASEPEQSVAAKPTKTTVKETANAADKPRRSGSIIGWFALLLIIGMAVVAWLAVEEAQKREVALLDRLIVLESITDNKEDSLAQLGQSFDGQLRTGIAALEGRNAELDARIAQLDSMLSEQRAELARFSSNDRESWLMAEAEYLLRLANQRLIMTGDAASAVKLMSSADEILVELDDVGLHSARAAIAADLAAIRALPEIDTQGLYLRLAALTEQASGLVIFELPEADERIAAAPADDWQGRLRQGYEAALQKLSDYIVIRRRDVPMEALMDPQWEGMVRQNLRMLIEQAQVALLSGNARLYRESLQRAEYWVGQFFESDEAASQAMAREIRLLLDQPVAVEIPDISRSLSALDNAIEARLSRVEGS